MATITPPTPVATQPATKPSRNTDQFPRSATLPTQSPLYWVEQKDRYLRQLMIRDIEAVTKRRLVVYYANRFENAQIDAKDTSYMAELFGDVGAEPVDLLLETVGGGTDATEALVSLMQNTTKDFRVIVAAAAKSALLRKLDTVAIISNAYASYMRAFTHYCQWQKHQI